MTSHTSEQEDANTLLAPFRGLRVAADRAADVAAPPYDVLSVEEARAAASERPWSFLHVSRPEIDVPPERAAHDPDALYDQAAGAFKRMIDEDVLIRDPDPRFYVYRMEAPGRAQTGLVAAASIEVFETDEF